MIKRINTLRRTGRFTELASGRGADGDFAQMNVVLGSNASGKSTLCDVLRSMTTGDAAYVLGRKRFDAIAEPEIVVTLAGANPPQTVRFQNGAWQNGAASPQIHVYDDRFVAENVLVGHHINVDQRRNLYGLVIGAQAIILKQAVDTAEHNLGAATIADNAARADLTRLLTEGQTIDSFRDIPEIIDVDQQIDTATEVLATATQTESKVDAIRQRGSLSPVQVAEIPPDFEEVLSVTLDGAALAAEQKIREHLTATSEGLTTEWLGKGHRAQTGSDCPHCGQDMDDLEILRAYRAFFSGELQAQENLRNATKTAADNSFGETAQNELRVTLTAHETERTWWEDAAGYRFELPTLNDQINILNAFIAVHKVITDALDRKQANPGTPVELTSGEAHDIGHWDAIVAVLNSYNGELHAINQTLSQRKADAGTVDLDPLKQQLASLQASRKRHQQDMINAYTTHDAAVLAKATAQLAKRAANEALRDQSNQLLAEYGTRINELLDHFSIDFRIVSEGVSFRGGQPSGQLAIELLGTQVSCAPGDAGDPARPSLANTLSGGDRSALALAFFLAKVEQDPNLANCVVVFDDPFHSQDRSRQSRTIERIHNIARAAKQCFVFSHDLDFARAVEPTQGVVSRTFLLEPLADRITLEAKALPMLPSRAYETKYALLIEYINTPAEFTNQLNNIAGTLRTILEEYLQLKFPQRWLEGQDWFGTMIGKIREATGDDPLVSCQDLVTDLTQVNEYSQRFHHRSTGMTADIPDARELVNYAKQTLAIIHK